MEMIRVRLSSIEKKRRELEEEEEKFLRQLIELKEGLKITYNKNKEELKRLQSRQEEEIRTLQIQQEELRQFRMMMNSNINIPSQSFDEEILKKLNRFAFNDDIKDKDGNIEKIDCCICLNDIKQNEEVVKLPCDHIHHWKCCENWLKQKSNCPMCRFEIKK